MSTAEPEVPVNRGFGCGNLRDWFLSTLAEPPTSDAPEVANDFARVFVPAPQPPPIPSWRKAHDRSLQVRRGHREVYEALATGEMGLMEVLRDPRAKRARVVRVLHAQRLWGPQKVRRIMQAIQRSDATRCEDLTERQLDLIESVAKRMA